MIFNSIEYLFFLPIVFLIYWSLNGRNIKYQNLFLLVVSYIFYGWWDWRFLFLIAFSSLVDYFCGLYIKKSQHQKRKKLYLTISMVVNLGFLGVFKYFNFFSESFADAFAALGYEMDFVTLNIVLPVGISFYTFQTMSYTIDIYRNKLEPVKDIIVFYAYVSFFPQLVAGPIERATNLLPQFYTKRKFDYTSAVDGLRQILWGLFKKIVVADNCAIIVNQVFDNYTEMNASSLAIGAVFFAFQIYGDFSGYSDIAIGTARLFNFNLMRNFAFPYFSRDIAEFWRRWHISLSTWFRDYLYIPLGGSKGGTKMKIRNTFLIFLVSGFWHGANWTFVFWGFLNALFFLPLLLRNKNRIYTDIIASNSTFPPFKEIVSMLGTFVITCIAWIFFRAPNVQTAFSYVGRVFSSSIKETPEIDVLPFYFIMLLIVVEWIQRKREHGLELSQTKVPKFMRWVLYIALILIIFWFGAEPQEFIYFQF